jgi:hypothetical protein
VQSHRRLAVLVAALSGCAPDAAFHCTSTQQCRADGLTGTCEMTGFCSFPDPSCPSGSRYMNGESDECVEVSSGADRDHDGVPDALDNCPDLANPDQGDEDNDLVGDACDPCPAVGHEMAADPDGDGLTDTCDPHPTMQDHLLLFEGFHHGVPADWTITNGTVATSGDSIVITPNPSMRVILSVPYAATTAITVSAGVSPVTLPPVTTTMAGGIVTATDDKDVLACELAQTLGSQKLLAEDTNGGTSASKPWSFQVDVPYTLTMTWDLATTTACEVSTVGTSTAVTFSPPATIPMSWHRFGVYASGEPLRIDWVMVTSL